MNLHVASGFGAFIRVEVVELRALLLGLRVWGFGGLCWGVESIGICMGVGFGLRRVRD